MWGRIPVRGVTQACEWGMALLNWSKADAVREYWKESASSLYALLMIEHFIKVR